MRSQKTYYFLGPLYDRAVEWRKKKLKRNICEYNFCILTHNRIPLMYTNRSFINSCWMNGLRIRVSSEILVLEIKSRASFMLGKCSTTELHPLLSFWYIIVTSIKNEVAMLWQQDRKKLKTKHKNKTWVPLRSSKELRGDDTTQ
jgi:hypothetical protein